MILRFLHGWGFDAGFWTKLIAELREWGSECDDRGYFGPPHSFETQAPCILVAHSFGAMRALAAPPTGCKGMVAINGFDRFTGSGDKPGVSPRVVDRMIARFASDPAVVLADFRHRCGDDTPFGPADIERLSEDLVALRDDDRSAAVAAWPMPILSVQGAHDPVLPAPMRDAAFAAAPLLERTTCPDGGHLLPVTHPLYCARAIRAFAEHMG